MVFKRLCMAFCLLKMISVKGKKIGILLSLLILYQTWILIGKKNYVTFLTMDPCPSWIASILAFTCCSITSLAVYSARLVTVKPKMKGITFFKKEHTVFRTKENNLMYQCIQ